MNSDYDGLGNTLPDYDALGLTGGPDAVEAEEEAEALRRDLSPATDEEAQP